MPTIPGTERVGAGRRSASTMNTQITIYIYLEGEGTDVWRPVKAKDLGNSLYQIITVNKDPEDERWQFTTGDIVRCEQKVLSDATRLVAIEKYINQTQNNALTSFRGNWLRREYGN